MGTIIPSENVYWIMVKGVALTPTYTYSYVNNPQYQIFLTCEVKQSTTKSKCLLVMVVYMHQLIHIALHCSAP